jgi:hypothetical protein
MAIYVSYSRPAASGSAGPVGVPPIRPTSALGSGYFFFTLGLRMIIM